MKVGFYCTNVDTELVVIVIPNGYLSISLKGEKQVVLLYTFILVKYEKLSRPSHKNAFSKKNDIPKQRKISLTNADKVEVS